MRAAGRRPREAGGKAAPYPPTAARVPSPPHPCTCPVAWVLRDRTLTPTLGTEEKLRHRVRPYMEAAGYLPPFTRFLPTSDLNQGRTQGPTSHSCCPAQALASAADVCRLGGWGRAPARGTALPPCDSSGQKAPAVAMGGGGCELRVSSVTGPGGYAALLRAWIEGNGKWMKDRWGRAYTFLPPTSQSVHGGKAA